MSDMPYASCSIELITDCVCVLVYIIKYISVWNTQIYIANQYAKSYFWVIHRLVLLIVY